MTLTSSPGASSSGGMAVARSVRRQVRFADNEAGRRKIVWFLHAMAVEREASSR